MRLSSKIMIGVSAIIILVNVAVFYFVGLRYEDLLIRSLTETAQLFHNQIVITRSWIARHGGVYVQSQDGVSANPHLEEPVLVTDSGDSLLLRNPALVTRELSELSERMGSQLSFHITSLNPINPDNAPNEFEREALLAIQNGSDDRFSRYDEFTKFESSEGGSYFRYFAPLYTEKSCLSCHSHQGYKVGDVRGGISIIIPAEKVEAATKQNYAFIVLGFILASLVISFLIYHFVRRTIIKPLGLLERAAESIGKGDYHTEISIQTKDEIADLGKALSKMQLEIRESTNKQIESEKMVALGQLSAGIAHEIRNPLFAVRNDLDYLKRHFHDNNHQLEIYKEMEEGIDRISRTVKAVLDYSKPHKPEFSRHHIREVIEPCMALLKKQFEKEDIKISIQIADDVPESDLDFHRLEQVFVNLLTNAKQAINGQSGEIRIDINRRNGNLQIYVSDNGCGIKKPDLNRIFDPFYTRSPDGTGLGLTIVHRIIEQHGGFIQVKTEKDKGTTFIIRLPIEQKT